jgi:hypothetical protein
MFNRDEYELVLFITQYQRNFVIRCSAASFKEAQLMLKTQNTRKQPISRGIQYHQIPSLRLAIL